MQLLNLSAPTTSSSPTFTAITAALLTAPTITDLTLAGGSTGASLVLGQGANASVTIATTGSGGTSLGTGATQPLKVGRNSDVIGYTSISFNNSLSTNGLLGFSAWNGADTKLYIQHQGSGIEFRNAGATVAFLNGNGNLLIGTTTDGGQKLQVAGTATFAGAVTVNAISGINALAAGTQLATFESSVNGAAVELITKGKNSTGTARQANIGINRFADDVLSFSNGTTESLRLHLTTQAATFAGAVTAGGKISSSVSTATGYNQLYDTTGITTGRGAFAITSTGAGLAFGVEASVGGTSFTGSTAYASYFGTTTATPIHFVTNSAIRATIDSTGAATFAGAVTTANKFAVSAYASNSFLTGNGSGFLDNYYNGGSGFDTMSLGVNYDRRNNAISSAIVATGDLRFEQGTGGQSNFVIALGGTNTVPTDRFTIASTGNATFAGAVSVNSVTPSTGAGSGALQVAGGIYAGANSVFGGNVTIPSSILYTNNIYNYTGGATPLTLGWTGSAAVLSLFSSGAATFAGAVTAPSATIKRASTSEDAFTNFYTGGSPYWTVGLQAVGTSNDFRIVNAQSGNRSLSISTTTEAATFAGTVIAPAATTAISSVRLPHGAAPTSPVNGDMWTTTAGLYVRINGVTVGPLS